jgi:Rrf2 family protein
MKLTKKAEYAIRAMIALGRSAPASMTILQIATAQKIPKKFLEQILLALKAAALVKSRAGPRGGYELAVPGPDITLSSILRAVEEPISSFSPPSRFARRGDQGRIDGLLDEIRMYIRKKLDGVTLGDLTSSGLTDRQVEELMWYI